MGRGDLVVAVGGGVVGDLAGFAAAIYMRGIDFINCPTTTLSMIDSSIGGKTAVDLGDTKNIVGAFWQPKLVIVDPDTLPPCPAATTSTAWRRPSRPACWQTRSCSPSLRKAIDHIERDHLPQPAREEERGGTR